MNRGSRAGRRRFGTIGMIGSLLLICLLFAAWPAAAASPLPHVLGSHMVLQHEMPVPW